MPNVLLEFVLGTCAELCGLNNVSVLGCYSQKAWA